jgi:hypothetical protein
VLLFFAYHPPTFGTKHQLDRKTKMQLLRELDFMGLFLFSAGCILFLLGVNWGGRQHSWKTAYVIAPMVLGVLCLVALGFWEAYANLKYPLMPPRLFKNWRRYVLLLQFLRKCIVDIDQIYYGARCLLCGWDVILCYERLVSI